MTQDAPPRFRAPRSSLHGIRQVEQLGVEMIERVAAVVGRSFSMSRPDNDPILDGALKS